MTPRASASGFPVSKRPSLERQAAPYPASPPRPSLPSRDGTDEGSDSSRLGEFHSLLSIVTVYIKSCRQAIVIFKSGFDAA